MQLVPLYRRKFCDGHIILVYKVFVRHGIILIYKIFPREMAVKNTLVIKHCDWWQRVLLSYFGREKLCMFPLIFYYCYYFFLHLMVFTCKVFIRHNVIFTHSFNFLQNGSDRYSDTKILPLSITIKNLRFYTTGE